jgi:hypothetical protein
MVPRLVPVVEPSELTTPSTEPRLDPASNPTEVVETAVLGINCYKIDPKKYRSMFKVCGSYQEVVNHPCEWERNLSIDATSKDGKFLSCVDTYRKECNATMKDVY